MRITPTHPLTMNGLRGFGFTVSWGDEPASAADQSGPGSEGLGLPGREVTVDSPAPTSKAQNDDFRRIKVLGSIT